MFPASLAEHLSIQTPKGNITTVVGEPPKVPRYAVFLLKYFYNFHCPGVSFRNNRGFSYRTTCEGGKASEDDGQIRRRELR